MKFFLTNGIFAKSSCMSRLAKIRITPPMTNCGVRRSKPSATDIKEAKSDSSIRMIPAAVGW